MRGIVTRGPVVRGFPWILVLVALSVAGCGDDASSSGSASKGTTSRIEHLVVIIQENISFDAYFASYCTAPPGSEPTCESGPDCCETGPATDPGTGIAPRVLDDAEHAGFDPNHEAACEIAEMNGGAMDQYVEGAGPGCSRNRNFAYADPNTVAAYHDLASRYALADHWFQPVAGQSSANDMYFARAAFVFEDNTVMTESIGSSCLINVNRQSFDDPTLGDLLADAGVPWAFYIEGYQAMVDAVTNDTCPPPDPLCGVTIPLFPCVYDPSDIPFQYYPRFRDNPEYMRDYSQFSRELAAGDLPAVSYVKAIGFRTEHPGLRITIQDGIEFVTDLVDEILASPEADSTLILLTYDESGGYFDHVAPPPDSAVDGKPYGPRIPTIAIGRFARPNHISHVTMEHSSVVRFIEWNWLEGETGQLGTRDAVVQNIGSLLDPGETGVAVPD